MFSQKRRKYKNWIWVAIAATAVSLAVILLLGYLGQENQEPYEATHVEKQTYEKQKADVEQEEIEEEPETPVEKFETYYLVKYDNDVIRIYFSDQSGNMTELEETTIVYEILSTEDQKRFENGVRLDSRDDLNKLLMDYES